MAAMYIVKARKWTGEVAKGCYRWHMRFSPWRSVSKHEGLDEAKEVLSSCGSGGSEQAAVFFRGKRVACTCGSDLCGVCEAPKPGGPRTWSHRPDYSVLEYSRKQAQERRDAGKTSDT